MTLPAFILSNLKFAFAALLAFSLLCSSSGDVSLRKRRKRSTRTIKILTNSGRSSAHYRWQAATAKRLTEYRAFDLEPGLHNVQITLPNGSVLDT